MDNVYCVLEMFIEFNEHGLENYTSEIIGAYQSESDAFSKYKELRGNNFTIDEQLLVSKNPDDLNVIGRSVSEYVPPLNDYGKHVVEIHKIPFTSSISA